MTTIIPIPALKDNYIWMIRAPDIKKTIIIDPGESEPVVTYLDQHQLELAAILITHHHWDHTQGIESLVKKYSVPVYGPSLENVAHCTHPLQQDDRIHFPELKAEFTIYDIPGHTKGHIAYQGLGGIFCGDTLFTAGCGRIFEGTPDQFWNSLQILANLPKETLIYCGHEYTERNLQFALQVEPQNPKIYRRLEQTQKHRALGKPTVPASLELELETNPFLRCHITSIQEAVSQKTGRKMEGTLDTFVNLRAWKDKW